MCWTSFPLLPSHEFASIIYDCGLCESPFISSICIWCCPKHLGRILLYPTLNSFFGSTTIEHLHRTLFHHSPLLFSIKLNNGPRAQVSVFKICRLITPPFLRLCVLPGVDLLRSGLRVLASKLKALKDSLRLWKHSVFGNLKQNLTKVEKSIALAESMYDSDPTHAHREHVHLLRAIYLSQLKNDGIFGKQKSCIKCLSDRDTNAAFFHVHY